MYKQKNQFIGKYYLIYFNLKSTNLILKYKFRTQEIRIM